MIYYYVCDSCGIFKELMFKEIVYCDNPIHREHSEDSPPAMRVLVPDSSVPLEPLDLKDDSTSLKGCASTFVFSVITLLLIVSFAAVFILTAKLLVLLWSWVF